MEGKKIKIYEKEGNIVIKTNGNSQVLPTDDHIYEGFDNILLEVRKELDRQFVKHGSDNQYNTLHLWYLIAAEEFGEVAEAVIESHFRGAPSDDIRKEAVETIACLIRLINSLD